MKRLMTIIDRYGSQRPHFSVEKGQDVERPAVNHWCCFVLFDNEAIIVLQINALQ